MKVVCKNWLLKNGNIVDIINSDGKTWQFERCGIAEDKLKELIKGNDRFEVIERLISEGKLKPIYGGEINLN